MLAAAAPINWPSLILTSAAILAATSIAVILGYRPLRELVLRQERLYATVLRGKLLIDVKPRTATIVSAAIIAFLAVLCYAFFEGLPGLLVGAALGAVIPYAALHVLKKRRLDRLESQLVVGIQTLASGVRAGLNLVQSAELVARDGPIPLRQEFAHMLREYEFGVGLDTAMENAADRIGSGDFRLLFSALQTHRQRGGDLGETLDRIAASIREIQRLESRVKTLTAQGRATARWLGAMPGAVLIVLYLLVDKPGVRTLFVDDLGKLILFGIVVLNIIGFLWIRKIVSVDI